MARNARSKDTCRLCGDRSALNESTWEPTGLCAAHSAAPVKAARKARNAARRDDREVTVTVTKVDTQSGDLKNRVNPYAENECNPDSPLGNWQA